MRVLRTMRRELHELWCLVTGKCPVVDPREDEALRYLIEQEEAANRATGYRPPPFDERNPVERVFGGGGKK